MYADAWPALESALVVVAGSALSATMTRSWTRRPVHEVPRRRASGVTPLENGVTVFLLAIGPWWRHVQTAHVKSARGQRSRADRSYALGDDKPSRFMPTWPRTTNTRSKKPPPRGQGCRTAFG